MNQQGAKRAFTLIEVLVVVAIIALLVAILLPSLANARAQARRSVCLSNEHQMGTGFAMYAADYKQYLPWRSPNMYSLKYTKGENYRPLCDVGALYGKYCGKELDLYYCPDNTMYYQDHPANGERSFFMRDNEPNVPYTTWSGYMYAAPVDAWQFPRSDAAKAYPKEIWHPYYKAFVSTQESAGKYVGRQNVKALVADNLIGMGVGKVPHRGQGFNVLFTDFHAKFVRDPQREIARGVKTISSGEGGAPNLYYYWELFSNNP
ncbi:MAG: type II secretion system protein [Phycisphaerae bacterium]|nr:type II secretion system protein [Phycisphaerae bacterium]